MECDIAFKIPPGQLPLFDKWFSRKQVHEGCRVVLEKEGLISVLQLTMTVVLVFSHKINDCNKSGTVRYSCVVKDCLMTLMTLSH